MLHSFPARTTALSNNDRAKSEGQLIVQDGKRNWARARARRNARDVRNIGNQGRDCTTRESN